MIENMCSGNRIGIFGGSFDPVHNGHIIVAVRAIEQLELDRLYITPAYIPPHKVSSTIAPYEKRMKWLEIAFDGVEFAHVSDYERDQGGLSFSLFTVRHFTRVHNCKPFLVIGDDSLVSLDSWYEYESLLREATIAVYPRKLMEKETILKAEIVWIDAPRFEISSTEIRRRLSEGKSVKGMVSDSILDEIEDFYG